MWAIYLAIGIRNGYGLFSFDLCEIDENKRRSNMYTKLLNNFEYELANEKYYTIETMQSSTKICMLISFYLFIFVVTE